MTYILQVTKTYILQVIMTYNILQVTMLLNAFRQDTDLTHEQIIKAMTELSRRTELRDVFSVSIK